LLPFLTTRSQKLTLKPAKLIRASSQIPSAQQVAELSGELRSRAAVPPHIAKVLAALPPDTHPMTQLSTAVLALQAGSC